MAAYRAALVTGVWGDPSSWKSTRYFIEVFYHGLIKTKKNIVNHDTSSFSSLLAIAEAIYKKIIMYEPSEYKELGVLILAPESLFREYFRDVSSKFRRYIYDVSKLNIIKREQRAAVLRLAANYLSSQLKQKYDDMCKRGQEDNDIKCLILDNFIELLDALEARSKATNQDRHGESMLYAFNRINLNDVNISIGLIFHPLLFTLPLVSREQSDSRKVVVKAVMKTRVSLQDSGKTAYGVPVVRDIVFADFVVGLMSLGILSFIDYLEGEGHKVDLVAADITHGLNYSTVMFREAVELAVTMKALVRLLEGDDTPIHLRLYNSDPFVQPSTNEISLKIHQIADISIEPKPYVIERLVNYVHRVMIGLYGYREDKTILLPFAHAYALLRAPLLAPPLADMFNTLLELEKEKLLNVPGSNHDTRMLSSKLFSLLEQHSLLSPEFKERRGEEK